MACAAFFTLPLELRQEIASYLSNSDIKCLRLSCKECNASVFLRFDRAFISANPLNIEVFHNIASHETFRHQVTEIVWDESRLKRGSQILQVDEGNGPLSYEDVSQECPSWFKVACERHLISLKDRKGSDVDRPDHIARQQQVSAQLPLQECWEHHKHLLRQQKEVLADGADIRAFLFGIKQFPALKRVTITPAAHGHLFAPLYPTPMIRAFPKGFVYPVARGWLYNTLTTHPDAATAYDWNHWPGFQQCYRGFSTAMRTLAEEPNSVLELIMTSNYLPTGINCTIFDEPCEEYDNFAAVLKSPGFRRLDLSLLVGGQDVDDLELFGECLCNGRLYRALSGAKGLQEFRLHASISELVVLEGGFPDISLDRMIPVEQWQDLRHFELSGFIIRESDLISFLKLLPRSVQSIELSMLQLEGLRGWHGILEDIRRMVSDGALWEDRDVSSRPRITIGVQMSLASGFEFGQGRWVEKEVHDFIYGEGQNPFAEDRPLNIRYGFGTLKDAFEPNFERPNLERGELVKLGICKP